MLQKIAKDNHFGSIWSGIQKNFVLGAHQRDFSSVDEDLKPMAGFDVRLHENLGFPLKFKDSIMVTRFQPWYERAAKRELEKASRFQFQEHQKRITKLPYGFVIDMHAERYEILQ